MFLFFLLWNVVLCNEATKLYTSVFERDEGSQSNHNFVSSSNYNITPQTPPITIRKKRNSPGNPATNRFICEICEKWFQREQNLQLHRRGHDLPWKLKQRNLNENRKKVYICPEPNCVHNDPSRALGDLSGIKKHDFRKHGKKMWRCDKCPKVYAVQSDLEAHSKKCGTIVDNRDNGSNFFNQDTFMTHRPLYAGISDQESVRRSANTLIHPTPPPPPPSPHHSTQTNNHSLSTLFSSPPPSHHQHHLFSLNPTSMWDLTTQNPKPMWGPSIQTPKLMWGPLTTNPSALHVNTETLPKFDFPPSHLSPNALLQKATSIGSHPADHAGSSMAGSGMSSHFGQKEMAMCHKGDRETKDFLGLTSEYSGHANVGLKELPTFSGMLKDEHELVDMMGRARVGYGVAVDWAWK